MVHNMHFCYVLLWLCTCWVYLYASGLLYRHWGNNMIALVPVKQQFGIWVNDSYEFNKTNDLITIKCAPIQWNILYALRQNNGHLISYSKFGWVLCRSNEAGQTLTCLIINPILLTVTQPLAKINIQIEFPTPLNLHKAFNPCFQCQLIHSTH